MCQLRNADAKKLVWFKYDKKNVKDIQRKFGKLEIKTHKLISVIGFIYNRYFRNIQLVPFLDYMITIRKGASNS